AGEGVRSAPPRSSILGRNPVEYAARPLYGRSRPFRKKTQGACSPMPLILYDTLQREKRVFEPRDPERVTLYVCGPTVYDYAHIGNARPPVVFDVLVRLLRRTYGADRVIYARNVTDVDDKI